MKHLFIINPVAYGIKGKVLSFVSMIRSFFQNHNNIEFDIHITRWSRDAVGYVRRYVAESQALVQVYAVGGSGTLFEVINGAIGLPNVYVGYYPAGANNSFIGYFSNNDQYLFKSLRNLVLSKTIPIDVFRCGNNYGVSFCTIGEDTRLRIGGDAFQNQFGLPPKLCYNVAAYLNFLTRSKNTPHYKISLDGNDLSGRFINLLIANQPYCGYGFNSGSDSHPNDGIIDLYTVAEMSKLKSFFEFEKYKFGRYDKSNGTILHHKGKKISVSCDNLMDICLDGETFFSSELDIEIIPNALNFICPEKYEVIP